MAVQAQFGGLVLPPYSAAEDYGALLSAATTPVGEDVYACLQYNDYCAGQSELTCNIGGGELAVMRVPSRKRGRDNDELLHYPALLLPPVTRRPDADDYSATALASTSGRCTEAAPGEHNALASELLWRHLHQHGLAEVDALVRAECDRLRAGLEAARQRQRRALVARAAAAAVSSSGLLAREVQAQLDAARRRAAELEDRVRVAAAEAQAWRRVARGNEAVAAGLQATLDALLLRSSTAAVAAEGFGESSCGPDDAQSCCVGDRAAGDDDAPAASASASPAAKRVCRACGEGEASVLVLPCRHLCLCKACEPRTDACPVCSGDKNAALHIAPN